jgi:hemerythrin
MNKDELTLGDPVLDREHADLQRLIDAFRQAPPAEALAALDALRAHAAIHFGQEDGDLRRLGGANATCHLDEHAAVLRSLDEVRAVLERPRPPADLTARLATELTRWLPEHVQAMDASIASVRTRERFGGAPVLITRRGGAGSAPRDQQAQQQANACAHRNRFPRMVADIAVGAAPGFAGAFQHRFLGGPDPLAGALHALFEPCSRVGVALAGIACGVPQQRLSILEHGAEVFHQPGTAFVQ